MSLYRLVSGFRGSRRAVSPSLKNRRVDFRSNPRQRLLPSDTCHQAGHHIAGATLKTLRHLTLRYNPPHGKSGISSQATSPGTEPSLFPNGSSQPGHLSTRRSKQRWGPPRERNVCCGPCSDCGGSEGPLGKDQGRQVRISPWREQAHDVGWGSQKNCSGSKGSMGKMAKGTEDGISGHIRSQTKCRRGHIKAASGNGVLSNSSSSDA
jgi:hypothetical protein